MNSSEPRARVVPSPGKQASHPGATTDDTVTPPHGDPERAQLTADPPARDAGTETLDERAMDQADDAGSALLHHDKVLRQDSGE